MKKLPNKELSSSIESFHYLWKRILRIETEGNIVLRDELFNSIQGVAKSIQDNEFLQPTDENPREGIEQFDIWLFHSLC